MKGGDKGREDRMIGEEEGTRERKEENRGKEDRIRM